MTNSDALDLVWSVAGPSAGYLGFVAVFLLGLSLVGLVGRW